MGLFDIPITVVAFAAEPSDFMDFFYFLFVLFILNFRLLWIGNEESVVGVSGRVGLRLEESIKVPERRLNITIGLHFFEPHFCQNFLELLSSLHEHMKVSSLDFSPFGIRIEALEFKIFP